MANILVGVNVAFCFHEHHCHRIVEKALNPLDGLFSFDQSPSHVCFGQKRFLKLAVFGYLQTIIPKQFGKPWRSIVRRDEPRHVGKGWYSRIRHRGSAQRGLNMQRSQLIPRCRICIAKRKLAQFCMAFKATRRKWKRYRTRGRIQFA